MSKKIPSGHQDNLVIGFDADDTLWHNESYYVQAQTRFIGVLSNYLDPQGIEEKLFLIEIGNLKHFGYGIKAFTLSMIETAVELTAGRITGKDIQSIISIAKDMLSRDVELLDDAAQIVKDLSKRYRLLLITKGDLLEQERKIGLSGLAPYFWGIDIISDKTRDQYQRLMGKYRIKPDHFLMIGNSLRSDIIPVLEMGGSAVYIPYVDTWSHEVADLPPQGNLRYYELKALANLPDLLKTLELTGYI